MPITKLSAAQVRALELAEKGPLICDSGNRFYVAGYYDKRKIDLTDVCERNTLESLHRLWLLTYRPDLSGRGRYDLAIRDAMHGAILLCRRMARGSIYRDQNMSLEELAEEASLSRESIDLARRAYRARDTGLDLYAEWGRAAMDLETEVVG